MLLLAHSFIHSLTDAMFNFVCPRKNAPPRIYFSPFFNLSPLLFSRPNVNHMKDVRSCLAIVSKNPQLGSGSPREQE